VTTETNEVTTVVYLENDKSASDVSTTTTTTTRSFIQRELEKSASFSKGLCDKVVLVRFRVARVFLVHVTKTGKMYQMNTKCTEWS
jgi:hypothetical protein